MEKDISASGGTVGKGNGGVRGGTVSGYGPGYPLPIGGVDASLKYEFLKNKAASLFFNINDIFATRRYDLYLSSLYSTRHTVRYRDSQFFRLQFNYRMGKVDVSLFKRKPKRKDRDNIKNIPDIPIN